MYTPLQHDARWGFVCGRISALEGRRVSREVFTQALNAPSAGDSFQQLSAAAFSARGVPTSESLPWFDRIEKAYRGRIIDLRENSPAPEAANLFLANEDYLNLGRALRGEAETIYNGAEVPDVVPVGEHTPLTLLPDDLQSAVRTALNEGNAAHVSLALDGAFLRHQLRLARQIGSAAILTWVTEWVLIQCVCILLRLASRGSQDAIHLKTALNEPAFESLFHRFELSGGTEIAGLTGELGIVAGNLSEASPVLRAAEFERRAMLCLLRSVAVSHSQTAGPERVFGFLFGMMVEMRNVRLLLWGLKVQRPLADLRRQLCFAEMGTAQDGAALLEKTRP
ncbi:MAG: V-type ATPase subunit [Candidatus Hydrogenedentes bacterium]|nr:V-type ATPase subunit [Candidatus Hydrogenedentota bacterium]